MRKLQMKEKENINNDQQLSLDQKSTLVNYDYYGLHPYFQKFDLNQGIPLQLVYYNTHSQEWVF